MKRLLLCCCLAGLLLSCSRGGVPKPYGYFRIATPDTAYVDFGQSSPQWESYPYTFALSRNAVVRPHPADSDRYWVDIVYPSLNATIHCSYKPVRHNLRDLTDDALEFVYRNAGHASAIPEQAYERPEDAVYGVLVNLEGNTASGCQFFLTDSTTHFFRCAVYCNCIPNADSLAPVYDYLRTDVRYLIETFQWKY